MATIHDKIVTMSDRGQITIPNKFRQKIPVKNFTCKIVNGDFVLKPLKTREEFLAELEQSEAEWKKKGGITLDQLKTKYDL